MAILRNSFLLVLFWLVVPASLFAQTNTIGYPSTGVCTNAGTGGSPGSTATVPGRWWNPNRPGTGWDVFYTNNNQDLGLIWYTFETNRRPVWYMTAFTPVNFGQHWWSVLQRRTWNGPGMQPTVTNVGQVSATLIPGDPQRMAIRWQLGSGGINDECIMDYRINGRAIDANSTFSGLWYEPNYSGYGVMTSIFNRPGEGYTELAALTTYDTSNQPVWLVAQSTTTVNPPTSTSNILNFQYISSNYAGGIPTTNCPAGQECVNRENGFGTYNRTFTSPTQAQWSIQINKTSNTTLQAINWQRPVGQGLVAAAKLSDATKVITNRLGCTIPEGQPTCSIVVDYGVSPAQGGIGVLFRRNIGNQTMRDLSQGTQGSINDPLPPGDFRYELRANTSPSSALLASSALVRVAAAEPAATNQIGFPGPSTCSTSGSGTGGAVPATPGLWWNPERSGTGWDLNLINSAGAQQIQAIWYTYDAQKRPIWLTTQPNQIQTLANGERVWWSPLLKSTWNASAEANNAYIQVGEVSLRFLPENPTKAVVRWRWNTVSNTTSHDECLSDFTRASVSAPEANAAYSGIWFERSYSGYGYQVVIAPTSNGKYVELANLTTYDQNGEPAWLLGQRTGLSELPPNGENATLNLNYYISPFIGGVPTTICGGNSPCGENKHPAGTLMRNFSSASAATAVIAANYSGSTGLTWQSINWSRPPAGVGGVVNLEKLATVDQVVVNRTACNVGACPVEVNWASHSNHFGGPRVYRRQMDSAGAVVRVPVNASTGEYTDTLTQVGRYRYELKQWDNAAAPNLALSADVLVSAGTSGPEIPPAPIADPAFATDPSSNTTGATRGEFRVDESGAANYSIPLMTLPGTGNMAPEMALNYSSRAGTGVMGAGWQISGQSAISRCAQATEHGDPKSIAIALSSTDRFCLDGQRLIVVQGTYGAENSVYRLESDQMVQVTAQGNLGGTPTQFKVERKDGTTSYYGSLIATDSARITTSDQATVFAWPLREVRDSAQNYMLYEYRREAHANSLEYALLRVRYTGNSQANLTPDAEIHFEYGALPQHEQTESFVAGQSVRSTLRLNTIRSKGENDVLLRRYALEYQEDGSASVLILPGRSILKQVQECFGEGPTECLPATEFKWHTGSTMIGNAESSGLFINNFNFGFSGDFDGDGRQDMAAVVGQENDLAQLRVAISSVSSMQISTQTAAACGVQVKNLQSAQAIDLRGTGLQGIIYAVTKCGSGFPETSRGIYYHPISITSGSPSVGTAERIGNLPDAALIPSDVSVANLSVMDWNGDGLADLVVHFKGTYDNAILATTIPQGRWDPTSASPPLWVYPNQPGQSQAFGSFTRLRGGFDWLGPNPIGSCPSTHPHGEYFFGVAPNETGAFAVDGSARTAILGRALVGLRCYAIAPRPDNYSEFVLTGGNNSNLISMTLVDQNTIYRIEEAFNPTGHQLVTHASVDANLDTGQAIPVDANADGLTDFLHIGTCRRGLCNVHLIVNRGKTFAKPEFQFFLYSPEVPQVRVLDYTGDGYPDLLVSTDPNNANARWRVHAWRPSSAGGGAFSEASIEGPLAENLSDARSIFLDYNGDSWTDQLLLRRSGDNWNIWRAQGAWQPGPDSVTCPQPCNLHAISRVVDGFGAYTDIEYRSLAQRSVYTRDVDGPYTGWGRGAPVYDLIAPMYVVAEARTLAPQYLLNAEATSSTYDGNATTRTRYYYLGAKIQAGGRGFLGFREVASYDPYSQVLTRTRYRQQFPYIGFPEESESSYQAGAPWPQNDTPCTGPGCAITSGIVLGSSRSVWNARSTVAGLVHPYLQASTNLHYTVTYNAQGTVNGSTFTHRIETQHLDVDQYGNVGQTEVRTYTTQSGTTGLVAQQSSINAYDNDPTLWRLGRLTCSTVTTSRPGETSIERRSSFAYDASTGILTRETVQPSSCTNISGFEVDTQYQLNSFGLRTITTSQARDVTGSRVSRTEYDTRGRYANAEFVTLGGQEREISRVQQRDHYGNATRVRNSQGVVTHHYFDPLGRPHYTYQPSGAWTRVLFAAGAGSHCPAGTAFREEHSAADSTTSTVCKDLLGRESRRVSWTLNDAAVYVDTGYDYASRPVQVSEPYKASETVYWTRTAYDEFGRAEFIRLPDGTSQSIQHLVLETRTTNALGQTTQVLQNVLGETISETVALGTSDAATTTHAYDALGRLRSTDGPLTGTTDQITIGYNIAGHKTQINDPDKGLWRYHHNGYGEVICQLDAKGQGIYNAYDELGRQILRSERRNVTDVQTCAGEARGSSSWTFHNVQLTPEFGQLTAESYSYDDLTVGSHQSSVAYTYDTLGRLSQKQTTLVEGGQPAVVYTERQTYDQFGRIFQAFDASGGNRGVRHVYGTRGHLLGLREAREGTQGQTYWELLATNARGQATHARMGNGMDLYASYEANTGRLQSLLDSRGNTVAQSLQVQWDHIGNLRYRKESSRSTTNSERFEYDHRNRLRKTFDTQGLPITAANPTPGVLRQEQTYDASGNLLSKSDVGTYVYGSSKPHAVTLAGGVSYQYDPNGNLFQDGSGRSLQYSLRDQVVRISKATQRTEFAYHHGGERLVRRDLLNGSVVERTHYIGTVEIFQGATGGKQFRRMIGGVLIATWFETTNVNQLRYLHKDHLGSTVAISNEAGQVVTWMSYDPWGQRRNADAWNQATPGGYLAAMLAITPRGYTGHEHVDAMGIIHMNGRIYDPKLGRFLQADPFIEDASTLNRYTYVHNNPLAYTDPSGYFSLRTFLRTVVAIAVTVYTGGAAGGMWSFFGASLKGATAFAAVVGAGAVSGAIQSGTIEGAAWGAFSAAVFFGIGQAIGGASSLWETVDGVKQLTTTGLAVKTVSHGLAGGTLSKLQGGKFGHGFLSAAGSAATAPFADTATTEGAWQGAVVSSVIGGTLSKLSGGKFANGAVTAAMSYAFNQLISESPSARQFAKRQRAEAFINSKNGASFLDMIQEVEGHDYDTVYGGVKFDDFSKHPGNIGAARNGVRQSAAGAFAINLATYNDVGVRQLGLSDFSPHSQRLIAAHILLTNNTDRHLMTGDFWGAVNANSGRWASLASNRPGVWASTRYRYSGQGHHSWQTMWTSFQRALDKNGERLPW